MREPIYAFATRARADRMRGGADADVADRERAARQQRMQVLPVPDEVFARPASKHHACAQPIRTYPSQMLQSATTITSAAYCGAAKRRRLCFF